MLRAVCRYALPPNNPRSARYSPWSISDAEAPADRSDRERSDANAVGLFIFAFALRKNEKRSSCPASDSPIPAGTKKRLAVDRTVRAEYGFLIFKSRGKVEKREGILLPGRLSSPTQRSTRETPNKMVDAAALECSLQRLN